MSSRNCTPRAGAPAGSNAVMTIMDCDRPSRASRSGTAAMFNDRPNSDGPVSSGSSASWTMHAEANSGSRSTARWMNAFVLSVLVTSVPEIAEIDHDEALGVDLVADLITAVERHLGGHLDQALVDSQVDQRRLLFGNVAHQFEAEGAIAAARNRPRDPAVERLRHIDARSIPPVTSTVDHAVMRDRHLVVQARRGRRPGRSEVFRRDAQGHLAEIVEDRRARSFR